MSSENSELLNKINQLEKKINDLEYKNSLLNTILNSSPLSILITNSDGVIEYVNPTFTAITEYSADEVIGKKPNILKSGYHSKEYYKSMWDIIKSGRVWKDVFFNKKKSGELYWEQQYINPILDENGKIIKYVAAKVDITKQKEFEEKIRIHEKYLKALTSTLPQLIFVVDEDGKYIDMFAQDVDLLYTGNIDIKGKTIFELFPADKANFFFDFIQKTLKEEKVQIIEYELPIQDKNYWFEARSAPFIVSSENKRTVVIVAYDISERKKYEQQLKELIATKDKFFSIIAHDLKNPLNALLGISELLYTNKSNEEVIQELTKMIMESSRNAYELLENLLEWARSQTGNIRFQPTNTNLKSLVSDSIQILINQAYNKQITIENTINEKISIYADSNLMKTIIRNLVSNGIKFTPNNGKITISYYEDDKYSNIIVQDNGIGMSEDSINQLFRIDIKRSTYGTNNEKGTGLGLILCKEFVELHNGTIRVGSELNKGTKFIISIPKK